MDAVGYAWTFFFRDDVHRLLVGEGSMNKQPEAIFLAEIHAVSGAKDSIRHRTATELRRLHEVNAELLFALKNLLDAKNGISAVFNSDEIARKAIAKAEGGAA